MQTTDDGFLDGRLRLLQPKRGGFRAGVDSVFLAAAIPASAGQTALEGGTGPGVAACCLLWRVPGLELTGTEREAASAALARENAARNGLRLSLREGDLLATDTVGDFDHAFANPPWFDEGASTPSPHALKARAHGMAGDQLAQWVQCLGAAVKQGGSLTFIHRFAAAGELAAAFQLAGFGEMALLPILPRQGEAPIRVLLQARKSAGRMRELPGFVLHGNGNEFTPQAQAILRGGEGLQLSA